MKVLPIDLIGNISADSVDPEFPESLMSNNVKHDVYKSAAGVSSVTIIFYIAPNATGFVLDFCNADAVVASMETQSIDIDTGIDLDAGVGLAGTTPVSLTEMDGLDGTTNGKYACFWAASSSSVVLTLELSNSNGETIQAGIARAGVVVEYAGPNYDFTEEYFDTSIEIVRQDKTRRLIDGHVLRVFRIQSNLDESTDFRDFIASVTRMVKSNPIAWIITDLNDPYWILFGHMSRLPVCDYYTLNRRIMSLEVMEEI